MREPNWHKSANVLTPHVSNAQAVCCKVNFFGNEGRSANAQGQLNLTFLKQDAMYTWQ
jgi:hypothetical protein